MMAIQLCMIYALQTRRNEYLAPISCFLYASQTIYKCIPRSTASSKGEKTMCRALPVGAYFLGAPSFYKFKPPAEGLVSIVTCEAEERERESAASVGLRANSIFHSLEIANEVVRPGSGELQNKALAVGFINLLSAPLQSLAS